MRLRKTNNNLSNRLTIGKGISFTIGLLLCLCSFSIGAIPKNAKFTRINTENGLSQTGVNDILQDDLGFMWFATQYGLNRYDGKKFDYFTDDQPSAQPLSANDITRLEKDNRQQIWIKTSQGLDVIHQKTLVIKNWSKTIFQELIKLNILDEKTKGSISDFRVDDQYLYTLINYNLLVRIDLSSEKLEVLDLKTDKEQLTFASGFLLLPNQQILVNSGNCFFYFNRKQHLEYVKRHCTKFELEQRLFQTNSLQNNKVHLGAVNGLYIYDTITQEEELIEIFDQKSQTFVEATSVLDVGDGYWLGTISGLKFYDKNKNTVTHEYFHDTSDEFSISNNDVLTVYKSADEALWISTSLGVSLLKPRQDFNHILRKKEVETFKLSNLATAIVEDSAKNLCIGSSSSGLYKYSQNQSLLNNYLQLSPSKDAEFPDFIIKLLEDSNQNLWVLAENGLSVKSLSDNWFKTVNSFTSNGKNYSYGNMLALIQDRYSNFWIGGGAGFFKLEVPFDFDGKPDIDKIKVINYRNKLPQNYLTGDYGIYVLFEDLQGYIWLGGTNGLVRFNPNNLQSEHYTYEEDNSSSISSSDVNTIYEDHNGVLWVGTANGLNRVFYNDDGKVRFKRLGVKDGFVSDYISAIQADRRGFLWISTIRGIVRYHPSNIEPVINYLYEQGLQHHEFFTKASYQDKSGVIYFGGVNGVTSFVPDEVEARQITKGIQFSKLSQGERIYQVNQSDEIQLETTEPLKIRVSNFDYLSNRNLQLRYRISTQSDWVPTDNNEIVIHQFDQVLELQVQQLSVAGTWSEPGIKLIIKPHFNWLNSHLVWSLIVFLISMAALLALYRFYISLNRQKNEGDLLLKRQKAKQSLLMEEKLSLLHQVEDLHYSLSEQEYLVDKMQNELEQKSIKDELTGLYSRGYIIKNIQHELDNIMASW